MAQTGVVPTVNRWNEPLVLGMVDPHDSLSHPAGVSDAQAESAARLDPDLFTNFLVSYIFGLPGYLLRINAIWTKYVCQIDFPTCR